MIDQMSSPKVASDFAAPEAIAGRPIGYLKQITSRAASLLVTRPPLPSPKKGFLKQVVHEILTPDNTA